MTSSFLGRPARALIIRHTCPLPKRRPKALAPPGETKSGRRYQRYAYLFSFLSHTLPLFIHPVFLSLTLALNASLSLSIPLGFSAWLYRSLSPRDFSPSRVSLCQSSWESFFLSVCFHFLRVLPSSLFVFHFLCNSVSFIMSGFHFLRRSVPFSLVRCFFSL